MCICICEVYDKWSVQASKRSHVCVHNAVPLVWDLLRLTPDHFNLFFFAMVAMYAWVIYHSLCKFMVHSFGGLLQVIRCNAAFSVGAVPQYGSSRYGSLSRDINLTNFHCYGNESHLLNCTHSVSSCYRKDYIAGVLCYGDVVPGL